MKNTSAAAVGTVTAAFVATLLAAAPADAVLVERFTEQVDYGPYVEEGFCGVDGLTVETSGSAEARTMIVSQGREGLPHLRTHETYTDRYTNLGTGETVTVVGANQGSAVKVVDDGTTLTYTVKNSGQFKAYDADGRMVASSAGQFTYMSRYDHAGTPSDPSDDTFDAFLGAVRDVGNADYCEAMVKALT